MWTYLASTMTFGEKCTLLPKSGLMRFLVSSPSKPTWLMTELTAIGELRNGLALYDDEDWLSDPAWVHDRMRRAYLLARRFAAA